MPPIIPSIKKNIQPPNPQSTEHFSVCPRTKCQHVLTIPRTKMIANIIKAITGQNKATKASTTINPTIMRPSVFAEGDDTTPFTPRGHTHAFICARSSADNLICMIEGAFLLIIRKVYHAWLNTTEPPLASQYILINP